MNIGNPTQKKHAQFVITSTQKKALSTGFLPWRALLLMSFELFRRNAWFLFQQTLIVQVGVLTGIAIISGFIFGLIAFVSQPIQPFFEPTYDFWLLLISSWIAITIICFRYSWSQRYIFGTKPSSSTSFKTQSNNILQQNTSIQAFYIFLLSIFFLPIELGVITLVSSWNPNFVISLSIILVLIFNTFHTILSSTIRFLLLPENSGLIRTIQDAWTLVNPYWSRYWLRHLTTSFVTISPILILMIWGEAIVNSQPFLGLFLIITSLVVIVLFSYSFSYLYDYLGILNIQLSTPKSKTVSHNSLENINSSRLSQIVKLAYIATLIVTCSFLISQILTNSYPNFINQTINLLENPSLQNKTVPTQLQSYSLGQSINRNQFELTIQSATLIESPRSKIPRLCNLDIQLINRGNNALIAPILLFSVRTESKELLVENQPSQYGDYPVFNPLELYKLTSNSAIVGSLVYNCTELNESLIVTPDLFRVDDNPSQSLSIQDFTLLRKQNNSSTLDSQIIIPKSEFKIISQVSSIPVEVSVVSFTTKTELNTRFCDLTVLITNNWMNPINYESFHLSLISPDGSNRPRTLSSSTDTSSKAVTINPRGSFQASYTFNCQDNSRDYTLKYEPFINFGPNISEEFYTLQLPQLPAV